MDEKKDDSEQDNATEDDSQKQQPLQDDQKKLKVKQLKGSPYVISLEKKDIIGQGSFGQVVRAYDITNPFEDLVAKIICFSDKSKQLSVQTELKVLQKLPIHPNLVNFKRIKMSSNQKQYLIMEYCNGGTLTQLINQKKYLSEIEIIDFLQQFSRGYKILYDSGIIHRDIKPDNILIHNKIYKIADFGLAKVVDQLSEKMELSTRGTPLYMAPELIKKQQQANSKVDMWSLGVILYRMMYHGRYPFLDSKENYDIPHAFRDILSKNLHIPTSIQRSKDLIEIVKRMLEKDDKYRISWEELFEHPIISPAMIDEPAPLLIQNSQNKPKELIHSSVFLKRYEILRVSKIKVQQIEPIQNNKQKNEKNDQQQKDAQGNQLKTDNQLIYEINNKLLENIIFSSNKRIKEGIIINHIEDKLLMQREIILFYDRLSLRISRIPHLLALNDQDLITIMINLEIILFKKAYDINQILLDKQNQIAKIFKFSQDDWLVFQASDKYTLTQDLFTEDKYYLEENYNQGIISVEIKNIYYNKIANLNEQQLNQEFQEKCKNFMKCYNQIVYTCKKENKKAILICCQYLIDALEMQEDEQTSQIKKFNQFTDFLGYYDKYEFDFVEQSLMEEINKSINSKQLLFLKIE